LKIWSLTDFHQGHATTRRLLFPVLKWRRSDLRAGNRRDTRGHLAVGRHARVGIGRHEYRALHDGGGERVAGIGRSTRASTSCRLMLPMLVQVPRARALKQIRGSWDESLTPPPHSPHFVKSEKWNARLPKQGCRIPGKPCIGRSGLCRRSVRGARAGLSVLQRRNVMRYAAVR
jgi:hypothetical protein